MRIELSISSRVDDTSRVEQVRGMFDLPDEIISQRSWTFDFPVESFPWQIGLITGPSGSGKSRVARKAFCDSRNLWMDDSRLPTWSSTQSLLDGFPKETSIRDITEMLTNVGFSSPPAWLLPYHALSTGQQFRCDLARLLLSCPQGGTCCFDEYTSTVDRTVAQIGSAAVSKSVRRRSNLRFVAITCHDDVESWLQPDWVLHMSSTSFVRRSVQPRPEIKLEISRTTAAAWGLFSHHHYLSHSLAVGSHCFLATWNNTPVCFSAWLPFVGKGPLAKREHRTVVLPDYQGVGIGQAVVRVIASMYTSLGFVVRSTTTHPGLIRARSRSNDWEMVRSPSLQLGVRKSNYKHMKHASQRLTAGFRWVGGSMDRQLARRLLG